MQWILWDWKEGSLILSSIFMNLSWNLSMYLKHNITKYFLIFPGIGLLQFLLDSIFWKSSPKSYFQEAITYSKSTTKTPEQDVDLVSFLLMLISKLSRDKNKTDAPHCSCFSQMLALNK